VSGEELVGCDDQCACSQFHELCKRPIEIVLAARLQHMQLQSRRMSGSL
jgi:hypothetical protein